MEILKEKFLKSCTLKIGDLFSYYEEFSKSKFQENIEKDIKSSGIYIRSIESYEPILHLIMKSTDGIKIFFEDNSNIECSSGHILFSNRKEINARDLCSGQKIDTVRGFKKVRKIETLPNQKYFDVSLPSPHLYVDSSGIIHHNTAIAAALAKKVKNYGRMLIVVPRTDLVTQTAKVFTDMGIETGLFYGKTKELNKQATICTWQSINAFYKKPRGMDQLTPKEIEEVLEGQQAIISDEAHTMSGAVLKDLFTNQFKNIPIRWGLTGTIPKEKIEAIQLELAIGPCVLQVETKELQDKGFLADSEITIMQLVDKREFIDYHAELDAILKDEERISYIAKFTKEITETTGNTLILIDRVDPGKALTEELKALGLDAEFVRGAMKSKDRQDRYAEVQAGNHTVTVATYGVASTGIDIQRIHNLVMIESGRAFTRVIQSLGRGLRKGSDKEDVQVFDICSSTKYSNRHKNERCKYYREKIQKHTVYKIADWRLHA